LDFSGPRPVHTKIPLQTARPGHEVLDAGLAAAAAGREGAEAAFGRLERPESCTYLEPAEVLRDVARAGEFAPGAAAEAARCLAQAGAERRERGAHLTHLVLENFQSHVYTELELAPGLNVVLGETGQGKSAIVRALRWLLCREPAQDGYVRAGARFCRVTAVCSDGRRLVREHRLGTCPDRGTRAGHPRGVPTPVGRVGSGGDSMGQPYHPNPQDRGTCVSGSGGDDAAPLGGPFADGDDPPWCGALLTLDQEYTICLNVAQEREGPFLLGLPGGLRARALERMSGAALFEAARRNVAVDVGSGGGGVDPKAVLALLDLAAGRARDEALARAEEVVARALSFVFDVPMAFKITLRDEREPAAADFLVSSGWAKDPTRPDSTRPDSPARVSREGAPDPTRPTGVGAPRGYPDWRGGPTWAPPGTPTDPLQGAPPGTPGDGWGTHRSGSADLNVHGGGVADVVSLALRVAFLEVARPMVPGPLVLDEPAQQVSHRFLSRVARLLKGFSDSFGRQLIVTTHNQPLSGTADAVFVLRMEAGTSTVHDRGSSIRASSWRARPPE
jgi:energy-coupling factor transporter ATP-binding protein EcfA2